MITVKRLTLIGALALTSWICALPSSAQAQGSSNPRYQAAIRQAETAKANSKYKDAAEAFRRANSLEPNPKMLYDIALMYQQAGERRLSLQYFKMFVDELPSDARVPDAMNFIAQLQMELVDEFEELVITTQPEGASVYIDSRANGSIGEAPIKTKLLPGEYQIIAELDGYVDATQIATLQKGATSQVALSLYSEQEVAPVSFLVNRANAKIYVDQKLLARTPLEAPLLIRQGVHVIRVMLAGHAPWEKEVRVQAQSPMTVDVVLSEQSMDGSLSSEPFAGTSSGGGGSVGPWITMGVGALLLGGSAYTGFSAQRLYGQLDERREQELAIVAGDIELGNTFVMITNLLIGAGALSLSAGGVWWAMSPSDGAPAVGAALEPLEPPAPLSDRAASLRP